MAWLPHVPLLDNRGGRPDTLRRRWLTRPSPVSYGTCSLRSPGFRFSVASSRWGGFRWKGSSRVGC